MSTDGNGTDGDGNGTDGEVRVEVVQAPPLGRGGATFVPPVTIAQSVGDLSWSGKLLLVCTLAVSAAGTVLLSVHVTRRPDVFYTGRLTPMQQGFFTLCFWALTMRGVNACGAWPEAPSATFDKYLAAFSEISAALLLFFFCDRTTIIPRRDKAYSEDFFCLIVVLFLGAGLFTIRPVPKKVAQPPAAPAVAEPPPPQVPAATAAEQEAAGKPPKRERERLLAGDLPSPPQPAHEASQSGLLMNRHQTDEWKGWMQMLFLWYHYFNNKDLYNAIRIFIAAYVWMTGFGNFAYYYNREDFSLNRFFSMMWRLNMLVICVCGILRNQYMLYYICPLHTLFTLTVYVMLLVKRTVNHEHRALMIKFAVSTVLCCVLWDMWFSERLFSLVWLPVRGLIRYDDPYLPTRDVSSEWFFRSFLDHYVWIIGMLIAYAYPRMERWLLRLEDNGHGANRPRMLAVKWVIGLVAAGAMVAHYRMVLTQPKMAYNAIHPYTSAVPILAFLVLRNLSQRVRGHYLGLFEWFGKLTLETYIAQYHIWMATTGANGSPKKLLRFLPGDRPMCDFVIGSVLMFFVSYRLGTATDATKELFFPSKATDRVLCLNVLTAGLVVLGAAGGFLFGGLWV